MKQLRGVIGLMGLLLLGGESLQAAAPLPSKQNPLEDWAPLPALVEFARARRIPLEKIEFAPNTTGPRRGDQVTMLIRLMRDGSERQWLATIEADDLTAEETKMKPPRGEVVYTITGLKLTFVKSRTALRIYLAGPFFANARANNPLPIESHARALVSPEYLTHGLEPFGRTGTQVGKRMREAGLNERDFRYGTKPIPLSEAELNAGRQSMARFALTPDEERAENEGFFATTTFFEAARSIRRFNDLAQEVMDLPSLASMVIHAGFSTSYDFGWVQVTTVAADKAPVSGPTYEFPIKVFFNGKLGTQATLAVTTPRPPLQVCGGILAIEAEHPADPTRRLILRVIASRAAPNAKSARIGAAPIDGSESSRSASGKL